MVGFGQAKTPDFFAGRQVGQPALFLFVGAESGDGPHHEAALNRGEAAQAAVAALKLFANDAVHGATQARATRFLDARTEQAQGAHLGDQFGGESAGLEMLTHHGHELAVDELPHGVAHAAFFITQIAGELVEVDALVVRHVS